MVFMRKMVLAIFVSDATSSTMVVHTLSSRATSTRWFGYRSLGILMLVLLSMLVDYFNGCARAHSLGIAAQIKIMGEPSLILSGLWFDIYVMFLWLPSEKYKIRLWKKKSLKISKIFLFSFTLYFVIARDSFCISTMYYLPL